MRPWDFSLTHTRTKNKKETRGVGKYGHSDYVRESITKFKGPGSRQAENSPGILNVNTAVSACRVLPIFLPFRGKDQPFCAKCSHMKNALCM